MDELMNDKLFEFWKFYSQIIFGTQQFRYIICYECQVALI